MKQFILAALMAGLCITPRAHAVDPSKPAILFLSLPMQSFYGGAYMRKNMARLDKLGYRIAYHSYDDFLKKDPTLIQSFDVVVMLDMPQIDPAEGKILTPPTAVMYAELRKLMASGGGVMVFGYPHIEYMKMYDALLDRYGVHELTGCLIDDNPTLTTHGALWCAYTTEIAPHPLTAGVDGLWYPVGGKKGIKTNFDTLRNANTAPFDVDENWTVLAATAATTSFKSFGPDEGASNPWLQQDRFTRLSKSVAPLVAVREGAEGRGRLAVCGINGVFSNFHSGNEVFNGLCTGKGVEGKKSDLDRLLMNVLDWLSEPSIAASRPTVESSDRESFALTPFKWPDPQPISDVRPLQPNKDQFQGIIGARSSYSGGSSTVEQYAKAARALGLQYLVFLEDYASLNPDEFEAFKSDCEANSSEDLALIPGIRIQSELGIWYFGFRKGLKLPQKEFLKPDTRTLLHYQTPEGKIMPGHYRWSVANGAREQMAAGNFRLEDKAPAGIPPENFNLLNPFISIYTYQNGQQVDTMLDTYLKCAARTEWVSPMAVNLIDSAAELETQWNSDHFKTVYLREAGQGLDGFNKDIGDHYAWAPITYVTNGPTIEQWRSSGFDCGGGWFDFTRLRWFVKLAVSSEAGLKEIRILDGQREIRRFLPEGKKRFEHTLVLTHNDMHNLILIATDNDNRQAISDEVWDKNQLLQLTWCADRNNMLSFAGLPAPKAASGNTGGNYPTPWNLEKGGFRENLIPAVNMDRSRMPHFDGQPYWTARVSPAPVVVSAEGSEGGPRIARDIGRDISSPDVAIQTAGCRLVYDKSVEQPHPWHKGPLVPMELFEADLRYITFSHAGHLPAPVILEGRIKFLKDLTFEKNAQPIGVRVLSMTTWNDLDAYDTAVIMHSKSNNLVTRIDRTGGPTTAGQGMFNHGTYAYFFPSPFGSVGVMSLDDNLSYHYVNKCLLVGYDMRGRTVKAGDELTYRLMVFTSGFDEVPSTRLPEALRDQLGINENNSVNYTVNIEHGTIESQQYVLRIDGQGVGFAGEIKLPKGFPVSLPIAVENLNDQWSSVMYDRAAKKLRPLGSHDNTAYCHRAPEDRDGRIFIGHPFTLDSTQLWLSAVQTRDGEMTVQIHNPTDTVIAAQVRRSSAFDFVTCKDFDVDVPAGATVEYVISNAEVKPFAPKQD